ncbi:MAG: ferritin family protein [Candidatus Methanomethylicaceae archaeon]
MELGTFGAILKFANELESESLDFYKRLSETTQGELKNLFSSLAEASRKNQQIIEKTRRMNVAEMILETITGFNSDTYAVDLQTSNDLKECINKAINLEEKAAQFYKDASNKLAFLPDVKRILEKLGKDREGRIQKLKGMF